MQDYLEDLLDLTCDDVDLDEDYVDDYSDC